MYVFKHVCVFRQNSHAHVFILLLRKQFFNSTDDHLHFLQYSLKL